MPKNRVVVTGMGVVSSIGVNVSEYTDSLKKGNSGSILVTSFDTQNYTRKYAAEIQSKSFSIQSPCITSELALNAAHEAIQQAGIDFNQANRNRIGVSIGTSIGGIPLWAEYVKSGKDKPHLLREVQSKVAFDIANKYKLSGPCGTFVTACASGSNSVGYALDMIRDGRSDIMIAGGADPITELSFSGFHSLMSMSEKEAKPFDKNREGMILGEGSAIMIFENLDHAKSRNAFIYAEVIGYGLSNDAYHPTSPDPAGGGAARCIRACLQDAGVSPDEIDYINAHGTGTKYNDLMELNGLLKIFGERLKSIPISSTKSMIGHTLGNAGSIEALTCIIAINQGFIPPTANFETPMEGFEDYNFVPNTPQMKQIRMALSCSYAFAGNSVAILIKKYEE